jgi:hypothetical protein
MALKIDYSLPYIRVDEIEPDVIWTRIRSGKWAGALLAWKEPHGKWVKGIIEFKSSVDRLTAIERRIKKNDFHQNIDDPLAIDTYSLNTLIKEQRSAKLITVMV